MVPFRVKGIEFDSRRGEDRRDWHVEAGRRTLMDDKE